MKISKLVHCLALALSLSAQPLVFGETKHPAEEREVTSQNSNVPTSITFVNSTERRVKLYWLNYSGKRELYATVEPKARLTQATFLTHPWLITDEDDNAWYVYFADSEPRTVEIVDPAATPANGSPREKSESGK